MHILYIKQSQVDIYNVEGLPDSETKGIAVHCRDLLSASAFYDLAFRISLAGINSCSSIIQTNGTKPLEVCVWQIPQAHVKVHYTTERKIYNSRTWYNCKERKETKMIFQQTAWGKLCWQTLCYASCPAKEQFGLAKEWDRIFQNCEMGLLLFNYGYRYGFRQQATTC